MDDSEFPFERLEVFQLAMQLAPIIQAIVSRLPPGYGDLRDHIRRSERSIRLNISEGSGKRPARMKAARYDTARASANECAAAIAEVRLFRLADERQINEADALLRRITRMLTRLIQRWDAEGRFG